MMPTAVHPGSIDKPVLRRGAQVFLDDTELRLTYHERTCTLSFPPEGRTTVVELIGALQTGGCTQAELIDRMPTIAQELPSILEELDELHLLTDSAACAPDGLISGRQLYREIRRACANYEQPHVEGAFYTALQDGMLSRREVIGYALEYLWFVRSAPALIAPAITTAVHPAQRRLLESFLASEMGHDEYLVCALGAAGIDTRNLELVQPLPTTFSLGASLGVYAVQDPLSMYAALFLFERPQTKFVTAFERCCASLGLGEAFCLPLRQHAQLNDDGHHQDISANLLDLVPVVDPETGSVVKKHIIVLLETLYRQDQEILTYYGNTALPLVRYFT
jgi:hypothetical protein